MHQLEAYREATHGLLETHKHAHIQLLNHLREVGGGLFGWVGSTMVGKVCRFGIRLLFIILTQPLFRRSTCCT